MEMFSATCSTIWESFVSKVHIRIEWNEIRLKAFHRQLTVEKVPHKLISRWISLTPLSRNLLGQRIGDWIRVRGGINWDISANGCWTFWQRPCHWWVPGGHFSFWSQALSSFNQWGTEILKGTQEFQQFRDIWTRRKWSQALSDILNQGVIFKVEFSDDVAKQNEERA